MLVEVTSAADPRLADYVSLRDAQLRQSLEVERGLFIAEGDKIIRRAADAGCRPRSFLLQERWLPGLADVLERWEDVACYVVTGEVAEQVSGFHVHRGALASFHRPAEASWDRVLAGERLLLCEELVDHTNAGSIVRVAAALGWDAVVISPGSADPLYRRAIKASMGASLSVPWRRMTEPAADLQRVRTAGFQVVASTLGERAVPLAEFEPHRRVALMLGNEGHGLSDTWLECADVQVTIPMQNGTDSLNVATAAAILAWQLRTPG